MYIVCIVYIVFIVYIVYSVYVPVTVELSKRAFRNSATRPCKSSNCIAIDIVCEGGIGGEGRKKGAREG